MLAFFITLPLVLGCVLIIFYFERKVASFIQDRMGPMEVGKFGTLQPVADLLKLLQKEDIVPSKSDRNIFKFAPIVIFIAIFTGFALIPFNAIFSPARLDLGLYFILAIISIDVIGLLAAGWSSNNKYALFGAMRSVAQIVSYEVPLGLTVLCVVIFCQSMDLQVIAAQQGITVGQSGWGGIFSWNIFRVPHFFIVYIIFFIATLAECNRAPFDIPEAESELVAGFHVEYSGFRFAIFFLSEYALMFLVSLLGAILFLGAWNSPLPNIGSVKLFDYTNGNPGFASGILWGSFWLISKALLATLVQIWIRWTFPRLRIDQLMNLCWKVLTPAGIVLVLFTALWKLFFF